MGNSIIGETPSLEMLINTPSLIADGNGIAEIWQIHWIKWSRHPSMLSLVPAKPLLNAVQYAGQYSGRPMLGTLRELEEFCQFCLMNPKITGREIEQMAAVPRKIVVDKRKWSWETSHDLVDRPHELLHVPLKKWGRIWVQRHSYWIKWRGFTSG